MSLLCLVNCKITLPKHQAPLEGFAGCLAQPTKSAARDRVPPQIRQNDKITSKSCLVRFPFVFFSGMKKNNERSKVFCASRFIGKQNVAATNKTDAERLQFRKETKQNEKTEVLLANMESHSTKTKELSHNFSSSLRACAGFR